MFRTAEDLMGVPGIGPKTLAGLQDYVTTDAP
jgi:DNA uptake protein ComE-like DNA-binding protein